MNDLQTRARDVLAAPRLSPGLTATMRRFTDPDPRFRSTWREDVPAEQQAEANAALGAYVRALRVAAPAAVREWLLPLTLAVRNPPSPEVFEARVSLIAATCRDLPAAAFTAATCDAACRKFAFWPSASDIYDLLHGEVAELLETVRALREITSAPPAKPEPAPMTAEERAVAAALVSAQARRIRAELAEHDGSAQKRPEPVKAKHLSSEALSELYRQNGIKDPRSQT